MIATRPQRRCVRQARHPGHGGYGRWIPDSGAGNHYVKHVAGDLAVFLLWNIVAGAFLLLLDPFLGLPIALAMAAALLWGFLLRPPGGGPPGRRWATLCLRPLEGGVLKWTLLGVPTLILLAWAVGDVYTRIVPVPPESLDPFEPIMRTSMGRLAISIFAIAVAPVVEEFVFRGLIQRTLERRFGTVAGIGLAALLFALVHFLPWVLPLHFFLGAAFGFVVYATRSIWSGVVLHAANNAVAMVGITLARGEPETTGSLWEIGLTADLWISLCALVFSLIAFWFVARGMLGATRESRLRAV